MYEVFGQTFGITDGVCLTFRTTDSEWLAKLWCRYYNRLKLVLPNIGNARLSFDYARNGEGWCK